MKRILCACLAALMLSALGGAALAAIEYDFSSLTLEELYDVRASVEAAISALEKREETGYYEDGTYLVGADIPEGDYAVQERENAMFTSIAIRAGEETDASLVMHKLVLGQADVHLSKGTWVTLSEARAWPLGEEPSLVRPDGSAGEGAYLVGVQLKPGSYLVTMDAMAPLSSYSVYSDILGGDTQLTKFEVLHEQTELTLDEGDYVELSGCALSPIQ